MAMWQMRNRSGDNSYLRIEDGRLTGVYFGRLNGMSPQRRKSFASALMKLQDKLGNVQVEALEKLLAGWELVDVWESDQLPIWLEGTDA